MSVKHVIVDGVEYDVAPMEPEKHDRPSPAYPVAVTPEVAKSWLKYNYRNRNQRRGAKRDYASDMASGNYDINGTSVTFSRPLVEGEDADVPAGSVMLIDGQHRLESCIDAGQPFVVYVAYGIKPQARRTVDTGIKRQLSDVLSMDGYANTVVLAAIIKRAYFWSEGDFHLSLREDSFTHSSGVDFLDKHPELERSAEIASRAQSQFHMTTGQNIRQSVCGLAHWLFMQADETQAPEFFARLGDGAGGIEFDHPVNQLRRRLVKDQTQKIQVATRRETYTAPDWQMLCYYIRSWNVYLAGPKLDGSYPDFAMVGRKDSKIMPSIDTATSVREAQDARIARLEAEAS
jgi:hypothetical protein